jgi:D-glycero-alpha-D-manno-heptose-7-phosphate kinase
MITDRRRIESRAPTRIDLAGGTVDIWPLYLFLNSPITINLGIDLFAEARIDEIETTSETSDRMGQVTLKSEDQGVERTFDWEALDEDIEIPPGLILHYKLLKNFTDRRIQNGFHDPRLSLKLTTLAKSPAGAGLGGSSALSVAMVGALTTWSKSSASSLTALDLVHDPMLDAEQYIDIVRDIETRVIQVPAGLQDYYGAMFGGLQSLQWHAGKHRREWLPGTILAQLEHRLLLFYSGQSRNSGINNWALYKAFIDKQGQVRDQFQAIATATRQLEAALLDRDWERCALAIAREWEVRRGLATGISTPEMDAAFEIAKKEGAPAGKVCGAGGGGCFFVFVPSGDPELKARITKKITATGIRALPFRAVARGLEVKVSRA